ncbi:MAG: transposase [Actinobacteria bacterium]|nr:transposase [Actinomycetota bacterium]
MARIARTSLPDGLFHVASRGVCGTAIYVNDHDRRDFLGLLRRCAKTYGWTCHAYCLMTTHYHLVLGTRRAQLSRGLHWLNWRYASDFNARYHRYGHLFGNRFSARPIEDETYLFDACAYVILNPVKARLCERPEQWPWSFSRYGLEPA